MKRRAIPRIPLVIAAAGAGLMGFDADITSFSGLADNRTGTLAVPRSVYTLGADLAVGNFRLGGGVLYKKRDPVYAITYADGAEIDIGNGTYTAPEVTRLSTTLVSESWAPHAPRRGTPRDPLTAG